MKALYYVKTTLKGMFANGVVTIASFILFPILLACFMAFVGSTIDGNPLKLKALNIQIIDKDNTETSKRLVELLESDDLKEVVSIVDKKPDVELVIKEGYEENILYLNKGDIIINKKVEGMGMSTDTLKVILDRYHQSLYVSIAGGNMESLDKIMESSVIEDITIDTLKTNNPYEKISASMIGFVVTILILTMIESGYSDISINLDKRINATPITKLQCLFYDTIALIVYVFIIISAYVIFFRVAGLSFKGNILDLMLLILMGTMLVVSMSKSISTIFGPKYGKIIGSIIFILPLLSVEIFMGEGNKIALLTPTHYLNNAFNLYNLNGNLEGCGKWILIIFTISIIIYSAAVIKEVIQGRKKVCA
ncbi:ABC transporter permease [Clostridium subterminale]|uniref:ABC transporter permease n=1 Tax=Clostridium subterminale TaxID=1550 RepID=A0ABN1KVF8_CLOSU